MSVFNKRVDKQERFAKAVEGKSESKKRDVEEALLKPEEIHEYLGDLPEDRNELESRSVLIVFRDKAQMELVGELFSIRKSKLSGKRYITDISMLEHVARRVRNGSLYLENGKIKVKSKARQKPADEGQVGRRRREVK